MMITTNKREQLVRLCIGLNRKPIDQRLRINELIFKPWIVRLMAPQGWKATSFQDDVFGKIDLERITKELFRQLGQAKVRQSDSGNGIPICMWQPFSSLEGLRRGDPSIKPGRDAMFDGAYYWVLNNTYDTWWQIRHQYIKRVMREATILLKESGTLSSGECWDVPNMNGVQFQCFPDGGKNSYDSGLLKVMLFIEPADIPLTEKIKIAAGEPPDFDDLLFNERRWREVQ